MEVWKAQLDDLLDQAATYAEDWPVLIDMLAEQPTTLELYDYLNLLVPRLKRMQRRFNWVEFDAQGHFYTVNNYDFKMYHYLTHRYPGQLTITPHRIAIPVEALTIADREKLRQQL